MRRLPNRFKGEAIGQNKAVFMAGFEIELTDLLERWQVVERETILESLF